jgi:hypothetical protein
MTKMSAGRRPPSISRPAAAAAVLMAASTALAASVGVVAPAGAADPTPPPGIDTVVVDRTVTVTAGSSSSLSLAARPGPGPGPTLVCGWFVLVVEPGHVAILQTFDPTRGETYLLWCWYAETGASLPDHPVAAVYDPPGLPGEPTDVEEVSEFAMASMTFEAPTPQLSPPEAQLVGVPTWLAVTSRLGYPAVHAHAGPVWASVRPRLVEVRWELPDGAIVVCTPTTGVAAVWDPLGPADQVSGCTHTFSHGVDRADATGRSGSTDTRATVTWTLLRRHVEQPDWRPWRTLRLQGSTPTTVLDVQAVIR